MASALTLLNSGSNSEKVASLPIAVTGATKHVIYSVEVPDLAVGDKLVALASVQVTNDNPYNALFGTQLVLATSASAPTGTEISEASSANVTPDRHHDNPVIVGSTVATGTTKRFVNLVGYSMASQAKANHTLTVDADYGRLVVQRFREDTDVLLQSPDGTVYRLEINDNGTLYTAVV